MALPSIVVVNRTPLRRRALVECGVAFPPGHPPNLPYRLAGAVATNLEPLGARWPDGSPRWSRLTAVVDLPSGVHRLALQDRAAGDADPGFASSNSAGPWCMMPSCS